MPFVSVIIPCYNAKEYITRTIDALENQTYEDFEIVFVDDCSTDGTHDFLKEYGGKEHKFAVQVGRTKQNSGPALARNLGISMAKGKYIAFCDSDDWYDNDFIEKMVCGVSSGADMVFCGHKKVLLDGTVIAKTRFPESIHRDIDNVRRALTFDIDSLCCIMAKTTIISQTPQPV